MTWNTSIVPPASMIVLPAGDAVTLRFEITKQDGSLVDISTATEFVFLVATERGGTVLFTRKLSATEVTIEGTNAAFLVPLTRALTRLMTERKNYHEATVTMASGAIVTVSAGVIEAIPTMNKDLP